MKSDFKTKRIKAGVSQTKIASLLGVTRQTIVNYEQGNPISPAKQKLIDGVFQNLLEISQLSSETLINKINPTILSTLNTLLLQQNQLSIQMKEISLEIQSLKKNSQKIL